MPNHIYLTAVTILSTLVACFGADIQAQAATTYALGPASPLLDADYYAGVDKNGAGPAPGRFAMFAASSKNTQEVAFWMVASDFSEVAIFVVAVGDPGGWRRVSGPLPVVPNAPICWTPDNAHIIVGPTRFDVATGAADNPLYVVGAPYGIQDIDANDASTTSLPSDNWLVTLADVNGPDQIAAIPILPNGDPDPGRDPVIVTNFAAEPDTDWPSVAHDGSSVAFADFRGGGSIGTLTPDFSDVYLVNNLAAIIAAPKLPGTLISSLAPTSAADPNVVAIRTNEGVDNFAHVPLFSQDNTLTLFTEDWNNVFADDDFFATLALSDFDVMLSPADGSGTDIRFAEPGNQFISSVSTGGVRVLYITGTGNNTALYMSSLEVETDVEGDDVSGQTLPLETENGVEDVTLGDNAIQVPQNAPADIEIADGSGTVITLPPGQVVDFPSGEPQTIVVSTPTDPVLEAQLPPNAPVDAIPVVRQFEPEGAQFYPPVVITISYTDAEIAGLDEDSLRPYLYNTVSGVFDIPVPAADIVERNTTDNYIRFKTSHFSIYGLGGKNENAGLPLGPLAVPALAALLGLAGIRARRR